jgi:hypothetical protein
MATNLEALGARNLAGRRPGGAGVIALAGADDPWLWTPAALKARAATVHRAILDLNDGIAGQVRSGELAEDNAELLAWRRYRDGFGKWFGGWEDTGPAGILGTGAWSATATTLEGYEEQIRGWRGWYVQTFGEEAPGQPPPQKPKGLGELVKWLAIGAGGLAVVSLARTFRPRRW